MLAAHEETVHERSAAEQVRTELAVALLRPEAMPRLDKSEDGAAVLGSRNQFGERIPLHIAIPGQRRLAFMDKHADGTVPLRVSENSGHFIRA